MRWIGLGIAVVGLVVGAYFIGHRSSPQSVPTNNASTSSVPQLQAGNRTNQSTAQAQSLQKSLADITQEWRGSTAYVDCTFGTLQGGNYERISGSGLLVFLNSTPTVITNRHVVDNRHNDLGYCDLKFPDTISPVGYEVLPENIANASNGNDVAYLAMPQAQLSISKEKNWDRYSLVERSKSGAFACRGNMSIGDSVLVIGYPVYGSVSNSNYYEQNIEVTATEGIISGIDGIYYTTSAKVDSGNSGGLVIDEAKDCYAGVPTWDEAGTFESLGRILPVSTFLHY